MDVGVVDVGVVDVGVVDVGVVDVGVVDVGVVDVGVVDVGVVDVGVVDVGVVDVRVWGVCGKCRCGRLGGGMRVDVWGGVYRVWVCGVGWYGVWWWCIVGMVIVRDVWCGGRFCGVSGERKKNAKRKRYATNDPADWNTLTKIGRA